MAHDLTSPQESLALELFEAGAIKTKERSPDGRGFKLKLHETQPGAPLSPIYLNLRTRDNPKPGPLTPELVAEIGINLAHLVQRYDRKEPLEYTHVAGIPNAGDPIAEAFRKFMHGPSPVCLPTLVRLEKEERDGKRRIARVVEGDHKPGDTVLVIDDLITGADSKLETIHVLEGIGLVVRDVLVLVDREQGGSEQLADAGYRLHALFTLRQLLGFYRERGMIGTELHAEIITYLQSS